MTQATNHLRNKPIDSLATLASRSLGAVLSLGPDIATQLAANLRGFIGEFTGENTETITVRADQPTTSSTPPPADNGASVIDRVDVTTWAYDRVQVTPTRPTTPAASTSRCSGVLRGHDEVRSGCTSIGADPGPGNR